jgi:hypothetical protein
VKFDGCVASGAGHVYLFENSVIDGWLMHNTIMDEIKLLLQEVDSIIRFILDNTHHDCDKDEDGNSELGNANARRLELYGVMRRLKEVEENNGVCEFPDQPREVRVETQIRIWL